MLVLALRDIWCRSALAVKARSPGAETTCGRSLFRDTSEKIRKASPNPKVAVQSLAPGPHDDPVEETPPAAVEPLEASLPLALDLLVESLHEVG